MNSKHALYFKNCVQSLIALFVIAAATSALAQNNALIGRLNTVTAVSSTIPANGDVNPYGLVQVPVSKGVLVKGNLLISNFNNSGNLQGTGTTIVQITPQGAQTQFAIINAADIDCPGGVGLTTALVALRSGFVVVGSLPTTDGTSATIGAGCLIVLDWNGKVVETITGHHLNGPWDMTAFDKDHTVALFVTNVLNGTVEAGGNVVNEGEVVRLRLDVSGSKPQVVDSTVIGSQFPERTDPAALVIGPTGVAFDNARGVLYVADSLGNRIAAIPNALSRTDSAGTGQTTVSGGALNDPLGLTILPNNHLIAANGGDGNLVEVDPRKGVQLASKLVDNTGNPPGSGALFGLTAFANNVYFVDDASNTLNLLH
jgi:sugar lactone lactonase YvrE